MENILLMRSQEWIDYYFLKPIGMIKASIMSCRCTMCKMNSTNKKTNLITFNTNFHQIALYAIMKKVLFGFLSEAMHCSIVALWHFDLFNVCRSNNPPLPMTPSVEPVCECFNFDQADFIDRHILPLLDIPYNSNNPVVLADIFKNLCQCMAKMLSSEGCLVRVPITELLKCLFRVCSIVKIVQDDYLIVKEEKELNLLEQVTEKTSMLAKDLRKKMYPPDLKVPLESNSGEDEITVTRGMKTAFTSTVLL